MTTVPSYLERQPHDMIPYDNQILETDGSVDRAVDLSARGPNISPVGEYVALCRAVILQAMHDMMIEDRKDLTAEVRQEMYAARQWFEWGGPDFELICDLADLDPGAVQREAKLRMKTIGTPFQQSFPFLRRDRKK